MTFLNEQQVSIKNVPAHIFSIYIDSLHLHPSLGSDYSKEMPIFSANDTFSPPTLKLKTRETPHIPHAFILGKNPTSPLRTPSKKLTSCSNPPLRPIFTHIMALTMNTKAPACVSKGGRTILSMASLIKKRKAKLVRLNRPSQALRQALRDLRSTSNSPKVTKFQQKKSSPEVPDGYDEEFERKSN